MGVKHEPIYLIILKCFTIRKGDDHDRFKNTLITLDIVGTVNLTSVMAIHQIAYANNCLCSYIVVGILKLKKPRMYLSLIGGPNWN